MAWKQGSVQCPWDAPKVYVFPLFFLIRRVLNVEGCLSTLHDHRSAVATKKWFSDLFVLLMEEPVRLLTIWNLLVQPHVKYHQWLEEIKLHSWKLSSNSGKGVHSVVTYSSLWDSLRNMSLEARYLSGFMLLSVMPTGSQVRVTARWLK